jgi:two-component system OmpR family response regulator
MNILLVEDEPELSRLAADSLRNLGHTVDTVSGVEEALAQLEANHSRLHLLIADHRLPDGWGIALCLQTMIKYPSMKVAVVSGCLSPDDVATLEAYKVPFFRKPILYSTVIKAIMANSMPKSPKVD